VRDHVPVPAGIELSSSTWQPRPPPAASSERSALLRALAGRIDRIGGHRLRVAIDGATAAGKSTFGHEIGEQLANLGRPVFRASLDDFKKPWRDRHRYDRTSADGYYRNAYDYDAVLRLLLEPAAATGDGEVALCSIDPLTQIDHSREKTVMPPNGVLVVDGVFALRPELHRCWDYRIWLEVDADVALARGLGRDGEGEVAVLRDRFLASEAIYRADVDPRALADAVVDHHDFARPRLL
jgi:uridine kinase